MTEIPQTRRSLLVQLNNQSDEAWSEFLEIYESALFRFCLAKGLQEADAHDVLQDVLTAALKRIPTWDPDQSKGSFRGWLFQVARNHAVDAIKHRARKATSSGDTRVAKFLAEVPQSTPGAETTIELEYQRAVFDWAAKQVKSEVRTATWEAFRLTAVDGQKANDVAKQLGISVGSVYTAKCRVVSRIRDRISEMTIEPNSRPPHNR